MSNSSLSFISTRLERRRTNSLENKQVGRPVESVDIKWFHYQIVVNRRLDMFYNDVYFRKFHNLQTMLSITAELIGHTTHVTVSMLKIQLENVQDRRHGQEYERSAAAMAMRPAAAATTDAATSAPHYRHRKQRKLTRMESTRDRANDRENWAGHVCLGRDRVTITFQLIKNERAPAECNRF